MIKYITNFLRESYLLTQIAGPRILSVEDWARRASGLATPDELIAAAVIKNMAEHQDEWFDSKLATLTMESANPSRYSRNTPTIFRNGSPSVKFTFSYKKKIRNVSYSFHDWEPDPTLSPKINGIDIGPVEAKYIYDQYMKLKQQREATTTAAAKAKADMERNEAAWNLVEDLLNMDRNEFGALVPRDPEKRFKQLEDNKTISNAPETKPISGDKVFKKKKVAGTLFGKDATTKQMVKYYTMSTGTMK
jgi:hypothetical protein